MKKRIDWDEIINNSLSRATNLEKSEFKRKFNAYLNSKMTLSKLISKHNLLQENHEKILKEQSKGELTFIAIAALVFIYAYFFSSTKFDEFQFFVAFGLMAVVYVIKKEIYERAYVIEFRIFENEIQRYTNELNEYGFFLAHGHNLVNDAPIEHEKFSDVWNEQRLRAIYELKIDLLKSMHLLNDEEIEVADAN